MIMRNYLLAMLGFAMVAAMPGAEAQSNRAPGTSAVATRLPTAIISSVTEQDLRALALAEGHSVETMHPFDQPSVTGKTKEGTRFVLIGTACDKSSVARCQGIMMQVRYDADDRVTDAGIAAANLARGAVSTWWDKPGKIVGFTRYVVLDNGITWMNARSNLQILLSIQAQAMKKVWPDAAVSADAGTAPAPPVAANDISGEWLGQSSGNRVRIEQRPGGFLVTRITANAGQAENGYLFRADGPGRYRYTFPDGSAATVQILGPGSLRITNPDGWTEISKLVSR